MVGPACTGNLPLLDCRSQGSLVFEHRWEQLLEASVQHHHANLRYSPWPSDTSAAPGTELFSLAADLAERWWPAYAAVPEAFDLALKGRWAASAVGGLCFYGLVTALFLRAQYVCEVVCDTAAALKELQLALDMLGVRLHLDFMHEASRWPFDALDIQFNRDMLMKWIEQSEDPIGIGGSQCAAAPPLFTLARSSWQTVLPVVAKTPASPGTWRSRTLSDLQVQSSAQPEGHPTPRAPAQTLAIAIFGVHSTLMLEPVTMLRTALWPLRVRVRVFMRDCPRGNAIWGHHCLLQCRALGECRTPEGSKQLFLELVHMFEDAIFSRESYYRVADYLELLVRMYRMDTHLQAAALYVCTAALMCSLLRAVFEKPLLAYLGMQLHVDIERQKDQLWLMHFREMVRNRCSNRIVVHNFAMREQIHHATGASIDVVRPRALYAHGAALPSWALLHVHSGHLRAPSWSHRVLLFRSGYLHLSLFLPIFEAHLAACSSYPLRFRAVLNASDFVDFSELKRYRAAVLFPWDPALMAFYELYALEGPAVFLPKREWAFKVQRLTGWIWSQPSGKVELAGLDALGDAESGRERPRHPHSPWWRPEDSRPGQALHWYAYSDCERLPHLLRFGSMPELLRLLLRSASLRRARRGMQRHNRRAVRAGLRWYRGTVAQLLAGGPSCSACVATAGPGRP